MTIKKKSKKFHSRTLLRKTNACHIVLSKARILLKKEKLPVRNKSKPKDLPVPVISIPGFDKVIKKSNSKIARAVWFSILFVCTIVCFYQIILCLRKYQLGDPAIDVYFEEVENIPMPAVIICPADIFGKNTLTDELSKKYRALFKISNDVEIYFSDFLRLPNMKANYLWDMYGFTANRTNVTLEFGPLTNKTDRNMEQYYTVESVRTTSGTCTNLKLIRKLPSFGRSTYVVQKFPPATNWPISNLYLRIFYLPLEENPVYQQILEGIALFPRFSSVISLKLTKIINLDLPNNPCENPAAVEKCRDECIESLFYTTLSCRLPYLNSSLSECNSPVKFNESIKASMDVIKKKPDCIQKCPRKCEEFIYGISSDGSTAAKTSIKEDHVQYFVANRKIKVIEEFNWYTFTSLLSDVGGISGTFLGFCFLNCVEILEFIYYKFKVRKTKIEPSRCLRNEIIDIREKRDQHSNITKQSVVGFQVTNIRGMLSNNSDDDFILSITGFDRLLSSATRKSLKIIWLCVLSLATLFCMYEIIQVILEFKNGFPDTTVFYERNSSVKFPTFTFCPTELYNSEALDYYKEMYIDEFNLTNTTTIDDVDVRNLLVLPDVDVQFIWNSTRETKAEIAIVKHIQLCPGITNYYNYSDLEQVYVETVCCTCLSIKSPQQIAYEGLATNLVLMKITSQTVSQIFIHDEQDDPLLLDPLLAISAKTAAKLIALEATKVVRLHHPQKPTAHPLDVVKCERECFNKEMDRHLSCRLPFMKNSKKNWCSTPESFNQSMEISKIVFRNFSSGVKCNCPKKSQEYIYRADVAEYDIISASDFDLYLITFQSNIFLVVADYFKLSILGVFANICGNLGLFLGICVPSFFECLQFFWYLLKKKK